MFELLALAGLAALAGVVITMGALVVGAFKIAFKIALIPLVLVGFLAKAALALVLGLVGLALLVPLALSGAAVLAIPVLMVVALVWAARKVVATA